MTAFKEAENLLKYAEELNETYERGFQLLGKYEINKRRIGLEIKELEQENQVMLVYHSIDDLVKMNIERPNEPAAPVYSQLDEKAKKDGITEEDVKKENECRRITFENQKRRYETRQTLYENYLKNVEKLKAYIDIEDEKYENFCNELKNIYCKIKEVLPQSSIHFTANKIIIGCYPVSYLNIVASYVFKEKASDVQSAMRIVNSENIENRRKIQQEKDLEEAHWRAMAASSSYGSNIGNAELLNEMRENNRLQQQANMEMARANREADADRRRAEREARRLSREKAYALGNYNYALNQLNQAEAQLANSKYSSNPQIRIDAERNVARARAEVERRKGELL